MLPLLFYGGVTMSAKKLKNDKKFVLSKPYRQVAYQLNKAYDEMKSMKIDTNAIRLYEKTLEQFYERNNLKVANVHHITMQKQMSLEQAQELADITNMFTDIALNQGGFYFSDIEKALTKEELQMINDALADDDYDNIDLGGENVEESEERQQKKKYKTFGFDAYEKIKEKYGLKDVQQYFDWLEGMVRFKKNALFLDILSSDQFGEILAYSQDVGARFSDDGHYNTLADVIIEEYNATGATGDRLYNAIINRIEKSRKQSYARF